LDVDAQEHQFIEFSMESKAFYRTFIAVPIEVPHALKEVLAVLKDTFPGERIRWTDLRQLHVTLRFLGDLPEEAIGVISEGFLQTYGIFRRTDFHVHGLGTFSHRSQLKVLWAGIGEDQAFHALHDATRKLLDGIVPFEGNGRFRPHLTVARMKHLREDERFRNEIAPYSERNFGICTVSRVVLFRSILRPSGAIHEALCTVELE
jgi:2'-5' RNA ligase